VAEQIEALVTPPEAALGREVTPGGMMTDILRMTQISGLSALARADPATDLFPLQQWQRAMEMALHTGGHALMNYATPQGDLTFRAALAELVRERGVTAGPDEIMVTAGVTNGLALAMQLLTRPGDTVLVEQPTYLGFLNIASMHQVRPIGLAMDDEGLIVSAVEQAIQLYRPAFLYTIPTFHNPCGICLSPARRVALVELAERYNLTIVEDDIYGKLDYDASARPALKSHDRTGKVIYLSSLSKNLMPGLRLGYAVASPDIVQRMVRARQAIDICSPLFLQRTAAIFIEQGWWHAYVKRMLPRYRERRDATMQAMERFFPRDVSWTKPLGGFSCWVTLPSDISIAELYLSAIARGVAFAPGDVFKANPDNRSHLRLCFGTESPERLVEAITILGGLLRERVYQRATTTPSLSEYIPVV
jgi:2-aminoadipate transaminase